MNHKLIQSVETAQIKKKIPDIQPGATVEIDTIIREGNKERIQKFRGLVIAVNGTGSSKMITVRKISNGVGVEKKLPLFSPNIGKIKLLKKEPVRRSKLYFMRERVGKRAMRVKRGKAILIPEEGFAESEEIVNTTSQPQSPEVETQTAE